jgi:hypothetical protein
MTLGSITLHSGGNYLIFHKLRHCPITGSIVSQLPRLAKHQSSPLSAAVSTEPSEKPYSVWQDHLSFVYWQDREKQFAIKLLTH